MPEMREHFRRKSGVVRRLDVADSSNETKSGFTKRQDSRFAQRRRSCPEGARHMDVPSEIPPEARTKLGAGIGWNYRTGELAASCTMTQLFEIFE